MQISDYAHGCLRISAALLALGQFQATSAHEDLVEEVLVQGRRIVLVGQARSASEGIIGQQDLELRPLLRPGDLLESIPGMVVTQHSGSGKSNQMFLRGFNLDHGTDFATWIDGMPVNMRSHGHGQGYTDINFLIPETISNLSFVKGPYHAELGDFSSAGGTHIRLYDAFEKDQLKVGLGANGFQRLLALGSRAVGQGQLSGAIETQRYDGPWVDIQEGVEKINALMRYGGGSSDASWQVTAMHYDNRWNSADQIPQRAVQSGLVDELGSLDTSLGGDTGRSSLSATLRWGEGEQFTELDAYAIKYRLNLWSNFTYGLDDPLNGDQFEQVDDRIVLGASGRTRWQSDSPLGSVQNMAGFEIRRDDIDEVALYRTRGRQRIASTRNDDVQVSSAGVFYEFDLSLSPRLRSVLGLRADYYQFEVDATNPANSGSESQAIMSPKASLIYRISDLTEAYLSAGYGFHSNDARGTTITVDPASGDAAEPVDPLVASRGAELGLRTRWLGRWNAAMSLWYLELDSELLFVGDAGNTEATRPSRRWGLEFNNFLAINDVWSLEADLAWTDARFDDQDPAGDRIPGALETVISGALVAEYPSGIFASLRLRHFGGASLIEDASVNSDGSTMLNLGLGWKNVRWRLQVDALNLLDSNDHDIDYYYASRLPGEPTQGVEDVHYHVFEPRQLRAQMSYTF